MSTEEGREKERAKNKKSKSVRKTKIFDALGRRCVCCGETDAIYLEVDHVYNDRNKSTKKGSATNNYTEILNNQERFQILCCNCNKAKHYNDGELYIPEQGWAIRDTEIMRTTTIVQKKFSQELYDKADGKAKDLIKAYLQREGHALLDDEEKYACDIEGKDGQGWEVEIKYSWKTEWPPSWRDVRIAYRKKKLLKRKGEDNITFYILNSMCKEAWEISGQTVAESEVVEVSNRFVPRGELFYSIPISKAKKIFIDNLQNL
tara:strand:- start:4532 stop:5314 length:783 start_codon:yes stop_codon:yes gene_type:complete